MGQNIFNELAKINVNDKVEKKKTGNTELTYLSWTFAVSEITSRYPSMEYKIRHWDGKPYLYDKDLGYMVETSVTIEGQTKEMWLPVMDGANKAMKAEPYTYQVKKYVRGAWDGTYVDKTVEPATMMDINKTIMRCLVKNLAMFGLGIYIYAGEDLPTGETTTHKVDVVTPAMAKRLKEVYKGENLKLLLERQGVDKVEDIPMKAGEEISKKLDAMKKGESK